MDHTASSNIMEHTGYNTDEDDTSTLSSRWSSRWGGLWSPSVITSIAIPPATASTFSSPSKHTPNAYPSVIPPAAAAATTGPGDIARGETSDKDDEFAAETAPTVYHDGLHGLVDEGDAKIAAIRLDCPNTSVGHHAQPPPGERGGGGGWTPTHSPPRADALGYLGHPDRHLRERCDVSLDENRVRHRDVPPSPICDRITSNHQPLPSLGGDILDKFSCRTVEAATARVKGFLKNVRRSASLKGGTPYPSSLHVIVMLTEEGGNGSQGALRSVLRRIFQERNAHFIDHVGFIQVDALSGIWDDSDDEGDDEYSNNNAQLSRRLNIRQPSNNVHSHLHEPYPEDSESRGRAVGFSQIPSEIDALQQQQPSTNIFQFNPPSLGSNMIHTKEQAIMATHERLQQDSAAPIDVLSQLHEQAIMATRKKRCQYSVAAHNDSVSQLHHVPDCLSSYSNEYTSYNVPLPSVLHPSPTGMTIAAAEQFSPQDHGTMLLYNPYDPIEHGLQLNITTTTMSPLFFHGSNMGSLTRGRSSPILCDVSGPYLNTTSDVPRNYDTTAGVTCGEGDGHGNNGHLSSTNENFGLSPPPVLYIQQRVRSPSPSSPSRDSDDIPIVSSRSSPATHAYSLPRKQPGWGRPSISSSHHIDSGIHRAISESQATHIAHTRQQVADDIEFRRSLELASNESARNLGVEPVDIHEQERILMAREKYEADLELALRQSEHVHVLRQEEDERIRASEEQLIADLLLRTRIEEVSAKRDEEEILRKALITSLEDGCNVDENALLAEAVTKSVNDNAATPTNHDETLERVLQLSLEEEERMNEEEEILRRALITSLEDGWNVDESALLAEAVTKSVNDNAATPTNHDETLERVLQLSLEEEKKMNEEEEEHIRKALEQSMLGMARW